MYKILVTNDDGIESLGIKRLVSELSKIAIVYVVAPAEQQSAKGMSLTVRRSVHVEEVEVEGADVAYVLDGTPADCVKWGLGTFKDVVNFDYVFSGINTGYNLSSAVYYSGTVGAAREAALSGIKAIALSVEDHHTTEFDYISNMIPELLKLSDKIGSSAVLSVNAPNLPMWKVKGARIVEAAAHDYGDCYHFTSDGDDEYSLETYFSELNDELDNDYNLIAAGYATITPISIEITDNIALRKLQGLSVDKPVSIFMDSQITTAALMNKSKRWQKQIIKWAKCIDRLDMPALITEQHGNGETIEKLEESLPNAEKVDKVDFNAVCSRDFEMLMCSAPDKKVFLAGLETHIGIQQTALALLDMGFEVVIVEDCCASKVKRDHDVAICNLREAGCSITTCEAAVMEIMGSNIHHAYTSISELLNSK